MNFFESWIFPGAYCWTFDGGAIGLLLALNRPSRVGKLVLVASAGVRWNKAAWLSDFPFPVARIFSPLLFRRPVFRQLLRTLGYHRPVVSEVYLDTFMRILNRPGAAYAALKVGMELPAVWIGCTPVVRDQT